MGFNIMLYEKDPRSEEMTLRDDLWCSEKYSFEYEVYAKILTGETLRVPEKYNAWIHGDEIYFRPKDMDAAEGRLRDLLDEIKVNESVFLDLMTQLRKDNMYLYASC